MDKEKASEIVRSSDYGKICRLIGEMSWGIDLPSPMKVYVQDFGQNPKEIHAVDSRNYEPVFEAIYQKIIRSEGYEPTRELERKNERLSQQNAEMLAMLKAAAEMPTLSIVYPKFHAEIQELIKKVEGGE